MKCVLIVLVVLLSTSAHAQIQLKLEARLAQNVGVQSELLQAGEQTSMHTLEARVLDPSLLYLQADELQSSSRAFALSKAQAARIGRLYHNQQNATQAAWAQATLAANSDQKSQSLAQIALRTTWGDAVASWSAQGLARRINALRAGRASLVRLDLDTPLTADATFSSDDGALEIIGLLPSADAQTGRSGALLWLARSVPALTHLLIHARSTATLAELPSTVLIPRSAILRLNGGSFVFIQTADDRFAMRELTSPELCANGWLVRSGFAAGERIVTAGAASLLTLARGAEAAE